MAPLSTWPEGLFSALVAAAISLLGFGLKELYDQRRRRREQHEQERRAATESQRQAAGTLAEFQRLLADSTAIAATHFQLRDRLAATLTQPQQPGEPHSEWFARHYDTFLPPQLEIFQLLRAITANSMRIQNQLLLDWANRHSAFTLFGRGPDEDAFDQQLSLLRTHLRTWRDKLEGGFETDPRQCLVYLADVNQLGVGFPKQLESATKALLARHPA
jgi:hypothetical protein